SVIELALRQGDRFGLIVVANGRIEMIPAATGTRQRDRCLLLLHAVQAVGAWADEPALRLIWERIGADHMAVLLSDCFDDAAVRLAAARREVLSVQLLGEDEREFRFRGNRLFQDPESGSELRSDAETARKSFLQAFGAARLALSQRFAAAGIRHVEAMLDRPLI